MTGTLLPLFILLVASAAARPLSSSASLIKRAITTDPNSATQDSYDYIIVGGGTSGLAVAARLSEDSTKQVLVIEAGGDARDSDDVNERVNAPAMAYYNGIAYPESPQDWGFSTSNQEGLDGRQVFWPRGKILGGSSAVNGAYMTRASKIEYDAWNSLQTDGLVDWSWDSIYPYQLRAETFDRPNQDFQNATGVTYNMSSHGTDGPIHYGYPEFGFPQISRWSEAWENLNVTLNNDAYGGNTLGAHVATSCIDSSNYTRSYSASGYLWPNEDRPNLTVLTGQYVTRINFADRNGSDTVTATGVSFTSSEGAQQYTAISSDQVILSAGVIGSPHLLQLSGIGERSLLEGVGIDTRVDLPGVGAHLSDHLSGQIAFTANVEISGDRIKRDDTFASDQLAQFNAGDGGLCTAPNNAIAYVSLQDLFGSEQAASAYVQSVRDNQADQLANYGNGTVRAGFEALYNLEVELLSEDVGAAEILMTNTGYGDGSRNSLIIQAAIQRGLSKGSVRLNSANVFDAPTIDPDYFSNPSDLVLHRAAFRLARTLGQTSPISDIVTGEISPGGGVSSDDEWDDFIVGSVSTEYHPAGSCSMLPLELGGCVDTSLTVYGTSNVRVIDTSIIAVSLAAHLTDPAYMIGEYGANIIANGTSAIIQQSSNTTTPASNATENAANNAAQDESSGSSDQAEDSSASRHSAAVAAVLSCFALAASLL